jgi:hypothetical protein
MSVLIISELPSGSVENDDVMVKALDLIDNPPAGSHIRMAGPMEGGWRIVSLWDSQESFHSFVDQRLKPALEASGRPLPQFIVWDIERVHTFS